MGEEMARLLLEAGHSVTGYNRTKSRAQWLLELGMLWGNTPRGVAQAADVTLSMVRDTEALLAVTGGPDGLIAGLGPGKYYIDMSTVSPAASKQLAVQAAEAGAKMFDAPVSGSLVTLKAGQLSFMVGGDQEALEDIRPILQDIAPTVDYVGANGLAAMMKVAVNLNLPVQILAFSESLLLAEKMGISRELATKVLLNSVVASPALKYRFPMVLDMPEEPLFDVDMIQKDLKLALDAGAELKVPLPTTAITNQFLNAAQGMGLADKDFVILFDILRRLAGGDPEQ
ncbi:2-hydroxy-3-oxopropionate reductase [hydrothermal vent metagenome]|uniref:2-hydroxy-3-oxopropionate reductase n=1 Tax=hydrothermal vent metagenome TaxID=652676 RepID=A0A170QBD9_9ZZZZ